MKKHLLGLVAISIIAFSCSDDEDDSFDKSSPREREYNIVEGKADDFDQKIVTAFNNGSEVKFHLVDSVLVLGTSDATRFRNVFLESNIISSISKNMVDQGYIESTFADADFIITPSIATDSSYNASTDCYWNDQWGKWCFATSPINSAYNEGTLVIPMIASGQSTDAEASWVGLVEDLFGDDQILDPNLLVSRLDIEAITDEAMEDLIMTNLPVPSELALEVQ